MEFFGTFAEALTTAILALAAIVSNGAINILSEKQLLKEIVIKTNTIYWKNRNQKMSKTLGFKLAMLFVLMAMIIGALSFMFILSLILNLLLLTTIILVCSKEEKISMEKEDSTKNAKED